jgi:predicted ATPase
MGAKQTPHIRATIRMATRKGWNDYRFALTYLPANDSLIFVDEAYRYSNNTSRKGEARWIELSSGTREAQLPLAAKEAATETDKMTARTVTHLLRQCVTYQFHDTSPTANIKKPWEETDNARLRSDGANLAAVLLSLLNNDFRSYKTIVQRIQRVLPTFDDFVLEPSFGKVLLRWRSKIGDKSFGPDSTSDGSLRLFCLVTLLSLPDEMLPDVVFLDEPELGLHPFAIQLVAALMRSLSAQRQVIASTQSVTLVNEFSWQNLVVADQVDGAARFRRLAESEVATWLELYQLGEAWEKNILGGTPE